MPARSRIAAFRRDGGTSTALAGTENRASDGFFNPSSGLKSVRRPNAGSTMLTSVIVCDPDKRVRSTRSECAPSSRTAVVSTSRVTGTLPRVLTSSKTNETRDTIPDTLRRVADIALAAPPELAADLLIRCSELCGPSLAQRVEWLVRGSFTATNGLLVHDIQLTAARARLSAKGVSAFTLVAALRTHLTRYLAATRCTESAPMIESDIQHRPS